MDLSLQMSPLDFELGDTTLTTAHRHLLQQHCQLIHQHPELMVLIGSLKSTALGTIASSLSKKRCQAIKEFLIHDDIDEDRIVIADPLSTLDGEPFQIPSNELKVTVALKFFIFTP